MTAVVDVGPYHDLIARQKLPQIFIEEATGVSQATISAIMTGRCHTITTRTAMALIRGLGGTIVLPGAGGGAL